MKLSLEALEVLDAIQRKGSFAAAAAELHRVPSAITYTVQQLESDLDVLLFDRSQHRATLTPAGYELLTEGRRLLQAASDIECRIHEVAKGWEPELRIAVDTIIGAERLFPLAQNFMDTHAGIVSTRLRISEEVLGGNWDALISGRTDLVIGASGERPGGGEFASIPLANVEFMFVATPAHPIVRESKGTPLTEAAVLRHRAVSVADSSRNLPPRTSGLLSGQSVFTVPSMRAKVAAHIAGLGVGYLPRMLAEPEIAAGRLIALEVEFTKPLGLMHAAWRANRTGRALRWFLQELEKPEVVARLFAREGEVSKATPQRARKLARDKSNVS
jgi:DNA-binding transcriptional LysR family regulator